MESVKNLMQKAEQLTQLGSHRDSENVYTLIIDMLLSSPSNLKDEELNRSLSGAYRQVAFGEAIQDFTRALSYDKQLAPAHYNRGLIHYRLGRYEKAVEDMDKALHLDPNFKSAILCREQALADFQRSEEADQP